MSNNYGILKNDWYIYTWCFDVAVKKRDENLKNTKKCEHTKHSYNYKIHEFSHLSCCILNFLLLVTLHFTNNTIHNSSKASVI